MALIDVLIPTYRRRAGLATVLTSLLAQTFQAFNVIISDQSEDPSQTVYSPVIETLVRRLRWRRHPGERSHSVQIHHHLPRRGMAEQRHFLLSQSSARYVHFLDDDVLLDPPVMERMLRVIEEEQCGFVGAAATGLDYLDDVRPHEQEIELWDGPVRPEPFTPDSLPWERHKVNNAANALHLEQQLLQPGEVLRYKVAWVGGANVLYDRAKLLDVGGFSWWERLPPRHAGEEVVVQFLLIRKYGGCGILPSGTYHLGMETNVPEREHSAITLFADLVQQYAADCPETPQEEQMR
jgi:GT2 family glycosyltransferase